MAQRLPPRNHDPIEAAREALQRLRSAEDWDEPTPVVHVNVHQAPAARRSSPPPPPLLPPSPLRSAAPRSDSVVLVVLRIVGQSVQRMPPLGLVLIFLVLILAWVYLAVRGKVPVP